MKTDDTCPKCGYKEIIRDVKAIDRADNHQETELSLATYAHPEALIFKGQRISSLSAYVCARCGYVEFYVDDLENLKAAGF